MANKIEENTEAQAAAPEEKPAEQQPQQRQQVKLDDSGIAACYANFCRVNGTPG